jgi:hypothetical protein
MLSMARFGTQKHLGLFCTITRILNTLIAGITV